MTGRARGRASRHGDGSDESPREGSPASSTTSSGGETSGNGNGAKDVAMRGRGGLRPGPYITKPPNITNTVGTEGQEVQLYANYFRIKYPDKDRICTYHVDFDPNQENLSKRRKAIYSLAELFNNAYIFDGMSDLKSCVEIETPGTYNVTLDDVVIAVTFRSTGTISYGAHEMLRLYNGQMRRNLANMNLDLIGRYYYQKKPCQCISDHGGVAIFRGFLTACNTHDGGLLTVTETIFKFIRRETAADTIMRWKKSLPSNVTDWQTPARAHFTDAIVITKFNNKTYKVADIDFDKTPESTFAFRNSEEKSFAQYYQTQHNLTVNSMNQPLLVAVATERDRRTGELPDPVYLIPELCHLTGLDDAMRADHLFMREVAKSCKVAPPGRVTQLEEFIDRMTKNEKVLADMSRWELEMDTNLVKVSGRWQGKEVLAMGGETKTEINNGEFTRDLRGRKLFRTAKFDRWAIIFIKRDESIIDEFKETMLRVGTPMGIVFEKPKKIPIENDRPKNYLDAIKTLPAGGQLIVCLVPNINKDRYDAIKKYLCLERPMPSQVIVKRTLQKKGGMMSVCTKIAIQVACKIGGEPWTLEIPPKKLMIIGFDTYHDSSVKGRSAGAMVASMNQQCTQYYSRVAFHTNRDEMSNYFAINVGRAVETYIKRYGEPPSRIVIYRDGVGEGMIPYVHEKEVALVKKGIRKGNGDVDINLVFIVVTKRINTRFFARKKTGESVSIVNPPPGTIIDTVVTRAERYDFFLVAQSVSEGTVAPTMFDVLCDESGWSPTNHQKLAYKMTHLYFNWSGTVKVPAPCQYAHKLAFLSGQSLHQEPHPSLQKVLFFL